MIIQEQPLNVRMSSNLEPSNFRIKASKKAFEILSNGLYSHKVRAVIRELSTNAADSHVAAGKAHVPFKVHLPNNLEPYFYVKDEGVGLSPEQVNTIYTTYFESDKMDSNDFTGCLGLGSKSPFSYTDSFIIISVYDGLKSIYNAFKDANGIPAIALTDSQPTNECNGVEVRFNANRNDFYEFQREAATTLRWFAIPPIVEGVANFEFTEREYLFKNDKYGVLKERAYGDSHVVMGNVGYAITSSEIPYAELDEGERNLLDWGIDLFVNIGDAEVAANREKLSYEKHTIKTIKEITESAIESLKVEIENQISGAETVWQARKKLFETKHSILGKIKDVSDVKWNGQLVTEFVNVRKYDNPSCPILTMFNRHHQNKFRKNTTDSIFADDTPVFINDLNTTNAAALRVIGYLRTKNLQKAYIVDNANEEFLTDSGVGEIAINVSTLPKPERKPSQGIRVKKNAVKTTVSELVDSCSDNNSEHWKATDVEIKEGGIYVEIHYFKWKKAGVEEFQEPRALRKIWENLLVLDPDVKIYGIRSADIEKLKKFKNWVPLENYVKKVFEDNKELLEDVKRAYNYNNLSRNYEHVCEMEEFSEESMFGNFLKEYKAGKVASKNKKVSAFSDLIVSCGLGGFTEAEKAKLDAMESEVFKRYGLLESINYWNSNYKKFRTSLRKYIDLVDASTFLEEEEVETKELEEVEDDD
jgi:hypothetical protein